MKSSLQEDALSMLLYIFTGTLFPYIEGLDSWLFEGNLDDPYEEVFLIEIFSDILYAVS